jgi:hypothetical protein
MIGFSYELQRQLFTFFERRLRTVGSRLVSLSWSAGLLPWHVGFISVAASEALQRGDDTLRAE